MRGVVEAGVRVGPPVAAYLDRIGVTPGPPTYALLSAIHRAHLDSIPYDNLDIRLGRAHPTDAATTLGRIGAGGRAGYCFHHNGALEVVLRELGYAVTRRHGHVWGDDSDRGGDALNHLVLEVTGLPTPANPGGRWWPDLGLGEGFHEPLPLSAGAHPDGPLTFALELDQAATGVGGWMLVNDRNGSFTGCTVRDLPSGAEAVASAHAVLSAPPDGPFARRLVVQHRTVDALSTVRGCVWTTVDSDGVHTVDLTTYDDWLAALRDSRLVVDDVPDADLRGLWERERAAHDLWDRAGRP